MNRGKLGRNRDLHVGGIEFSLFSLSPLFFRSACNMDPSYDDDDKPTFLCACCGHGKSRIAKVLVVVVVVVESYHFLLGFPAIVLFYHL